MTDATETPTPQLPTRGTGCDRLLRALLAAYPDAVWSPNDPLKIIAHSRAPELRKLGWKVQSVHRPGRPPALLEYGYVLVHDAHEIETARTSASPARALRFDDEFVPIEKVPIRTGLDAGQLYWLHRHHFVPWDAEFQGAKQYAVRTLARLEAIGALVRLGVNLQAAAEQVTTRGPALVADLRSAATALDGVA